MITKHLISALFLTWTFSLLHCNRFKLLHDMEQSALFIVLDMYVWALTIPTEGFHGFSQSLQVNNKIWTSKLATNDYSLMHPSSSSHCTCPSVIQIDNFFCSIERKVLWGGGADTFLVIVQTPARLANICVDLLCLVIAIVCMGVVWSISFKEEKAGATSLRGAIG